MPMKLWQMSVAEDSIDYSSLIVTGGVTDGSQRSNGILRLSCIENNQCNWKILANQLAFARYDHVSMFTIKPLNCSINP